MCYLISINHEDVVTSKSLVYSSGTIDYQLRVSTHPKLVSDVEGRSPYYSPKDVAKRSPLILGEGQRPVEGKDRV